MNFIEIPVQFADGLLHFKDAINELEFDHSGSLVNSNVIIDDSLLSQNGILFHSDYYIIWYLNNSQSKLFVCIISRNSRKLTDSVIFKFPNAVNPPLLVNFNEFICYCKEVGLFKFTLINGKIQYEMLIYMRAAPNVLLMNPLVIQEENGDLSFDFKHENIIKIGNNLTKFYNFMKPHLQSSIYKCVANVFSLFSSHIDKPSVYGLVDFKRNLYYRIGTASLQVFSLVNGILQSEHKMLHFGLNFIEWKLCTLNGFTYLVINYGTLITFISTENYEEFCFFFDSMELKRFFLVKDVFFGVFLLFNSVKTEIKSFSVVEKSLQFHPSYYQLTESMDLLDEIFLDEIDEHIYILRPSLPDTDKIFNVSKIIPIKSNFPIAIYCSIERKISYSFHDLLVFSRFLQYFEGFNYENFILNTILHTPKFVSFDQIHADLYKMICKFVGENEEQLELIYYLAKDEKLSNYLASLVNCLDEIPLDDLDLFVQNCRSTIKMMTGILFLLFACFQKQSIRIRQLQKRIVLRIFLLERTLDYLCYFGFPLNNNSKSLLVNDKEGPVFDSFEQFSKYSCSCLFSIVFNSNLTSVQKCLSYISRCIENYCVITENFSIDLLLFIQGICQSRLNNFKEPFSKISPLKIQEYLLLQSCPQSNDFICQSFNEFRKKSLEDLSHYSDYYYIFIGDLLFHKNEISLAIHFYKMSKVASPNLFSSYIKDGKVQEALLLATENNVFQLIDLIFTEKSESVQKDYLVIILDKFFSSSLKHLIVRFSDGFDSNENVFSRNTELTITIEALLAIGKENVAASLLYHLAEIVSIHNIDLYSLFISKCIDILKSIQCKNLQFVSKKWFNSENDNNPISIEYIIYNRFAFDLLKKYKFYFAHLLSSFSCQQHGCNIPFSDIFVILIQNALFLDAYELYSLFSQQSLISHSEEYLLKAFELFLISYSHFLFELLHHKLANCYENLLPISSYLSRLEQILIGDLCSQKLFITSFIERCRFENVPFTNEIFNWFQDTFSIALFECCVKNGMTKEATCIFEQKIMPSTTSLSNKSMKNCLPWTFINELLDRCPSSIDNAVDKYLKRTRVI